MTILADYRTRILLLLGDPSAGRFSNNQVDEALRLALLEYSTTYPQLLSTTFTVTTAGKNQALTGVTDIKAVIRAQYPYEDENSPYNPAIYFNYMAGVPVLYFAGATVSPQVGEKFKLFYSANHTIDDLDSAAATTVPPDHDSILVEGGAGFASQIRAAQLSDSFASSNDQLYAQAKYYLANFRNALIALQLETSYHFPLTGFSVDG